nr:S8 family serine peptidase [Psychrobacillus psychrodurans]
MEKLNIFSKIKVPAIVELANVTFFPQIASKPLLKKNYVGWKVKVAVIDSGIREGNKLNVIYSKDFTGFDYIKNDHGTQVAKIVDNFAPKASFISLKVAHEYRFSEDLIIPALDEAMNQEADIINLSFGVKQKEHCNGDCEICDYVNKVSENGYTVVTAAGNEGASGMESITCPARADKSISVGQFEPNGKEVTVTSGKGSPRLFKPDILAPGSANVIVNGVNTYATGTSFSAPVITGVLASVFHLEYDRGIIVSSLYISAKLLKGVPGYYQGHGTFDLKKFLEVFEHDIALSLNS